MIPSLKIMFSTPAPPDFGLLVSMGAEILDVRTEEEFSEGHISGATNIPVQMLANHIPDWDRKTPIIVCCASGLRSAAARRILQHAGFETLYNAGAWLDLKNKLHVAYHENTY